MIPYFHALLIQRHGMISALMIYGRADPEGGTGRADPPEKSQIYRVP